MRATFSADGVTEHTRTTGTGPYVLAGPVGGAVALADAVSPDGRTIVDGDVVFHMTTDGHRMELALSTYSAGTLTPVQVISPGGKLDWQAGTIKLITLLNGAAGGQQARDDSFWDALAVQMTADFGDLSEPVTRTMDLGDLAGVGDTDAPGLRLFDFGEIT